MNNDFKKILNLLEKLNIKSSKTIVPSDDLKKEYQRIDDLTWLDNDTKKHLNLLQKTDLSSIDAIMAQICCFNINLNTYIWHIESMQDVTAKFITKK